MINVKTIFLILLIMFCKFCYADIKQAIIVKNIIVESISNYAGNCTPLYQLKLNRKKCINRSAYMMNVGFSPLCYKLDIIKQIVNTKVKMKLSSSFKQNKIVGYTIRIIDGDTIVINSEKIRLYGIDTPESKQRCMNNNGIQYSCGNRATNELINIIGKNKVSCKLKDRDRYGRSISVCYVKGQDINSLLVERGWALAYRKYSKDYVNEESRAKQNKLGLWSGNFMLPWNWRKYNR